MLLYLIFLVLLLNEVFEPKLKTRASRAWRWFRAITVTGCYFNPSKALFEF
jgi:hypothetical protein